ncbi:MAG: DUF2961 domain-containing protein [Clostridia bacterium]|nr:DUF2961 domain-containing protein [Clostridia bacterium]
MNDFISPARGIRRLEQPESLPVLDEGSIVKYFGSISKTGDNADWDWGFFQDENGEWILLEEDGAGCIFNFTQHRYPSSPVPVFRFYFDNSPMPQFTITPAEFGEKAPFLKPLADKFIGPEDGGRGPIWVVRSFVPMEFRTHCKITSSIPLRGCEKEKGEGGWGHVTYQLYDSPDGLTTFSATQDFSVLAARYTKPLSLPATRVLKTQGVLSENEKQTLSFSGRGAVVRISLKIRNFRPAFAGSVLLRLFFDGKASLAPLGTLFGCEYAESPADLETALLTFRFDGHNGFFENRFPMPFFETAEITLIHQGKEPVNIEFLSMEINETLVYDPASTGLFSASAYLPPTPTVPGQNTIIADVKGNGQFVYGVVSGHAIMNAGCEGDVRVFLDDVSSPAVESDGSESWASYGWGFVAPPQSNPFSCYHGVPDVNHTWSECRLTFTDSYPFRGRFRFELEHGETNNGGGQHSGQCFFYQKPSPAEQQIATVLPENIRHNGTVATRRGRFENGIHEQYDSFDCLSGHDFETFSIPLPKKVNALILKRVSFQDTGPMIAKVIVNGKEAGRKWFYCDVNACYNLLEDSFLIPANLFTNEETAEITVRPQTDAWNVCRYRVYAVFHE